MIHTLSQLDADTADIIATINELVQAVNQLQAAQQHDAETAKRHLMGLAAIMSRHCADS